MPLFQTDFRNGVAALNRLLNHAARIRVRTLARLGPMHLPLEDDAVGSYQAELEISGARQIYVGDDHVWLWYRGTGVGPYPCFSALQALERVCDQLIKSDLPWFRYYSMAARASRWSASSSDSSSGILRAQAIYWTPT